MTREVRILRDFFFLSIWKWGKKCISLKYRIWNNSWESYWHPNLHAFPQMEISLWSPFSDNKKLCSLILFYCFLNTVLPDGTSIRYTLSSYCQGIFFQIKSLSSLPFLCSLLQLMASPASTSQRRQLRVVWHCGPLRHASVMFLPPCCFLSCTVCWIWFSPLDYHYPAHRFRNPLQI